MKIRLYESLIEVIIALGVGIPLILGGVLDTWRTILTIAIVMLVLLYIITHRIKKTYSDRFLWVYILGTICIVTFELMKGKKLYAYSNYETFYAGRQYLWIFFAIPLYYEIIKDKNFDKYLKKTVGIIIASLSLRTITWLCKNYLGITIFNSLLYEYGISWGRGGKLRIDATALIGVLIPALYYLYKKYKKKRYVVALMFVAAYLVFVSQTRSLILGTIACVISMFFLEKRSSSKKLIVQLLLLAIFVIAVNMGFADTILNKMNITISDSSIGYRQYEFAYYSSLLFNGKWKTGLGILTSMNANGKILMFGNLDTQMYLDDLGIFECFLQFGLFSFFLYGVLLIYMIYVVIKCNRVKEYKYSLYLLGEFFYIVIVSIPLNSFGIQRIFMVPIVLAFTCAVHNNILKIEKEKAI